MTLINSFFQPFHVAVGSRYRLFPARRLVMKRTRVLYDDDDHPLTLEGLRAVLEPHVESVATVMNGRALVQMAPRLKPDLIILDISMPLLNGIDAAIQIRKSLPGVKLLFATMHASSAYLEAALDTPEQTDT